MNEQTEMFSTEVSRVDGIVDIKVNIEAEIKPEHFKGEDYDEKHDFVRLKGIMLHIYEIMKSGKWYSVPMMEEEVKLRMPGQTFLQDTIRRHICYMKHEKYGNHTTEKKRVQNTTFYRLITKD